MDGSPTWPRVSSPPPGTAPPEGAPPAPEPGTSPPAPRRWPWVLAIVALLATTATAGAVAWDQRSSAEQWRERAEAIEDQRDDALGRGEALQR
jgi:hypothetical protein